MRSEELARLLKSALCRDFSWKRSNWSFHSNGRIQFGQCACGVVCVCGHTQAILKRFKNNSQNGVSRQFSSTKWFKVFRSKARNLSIMLDFDCAGNTSWVAQHIDSNQASKAAHDGVIDWFRTVVFNSIRSKFASWSWDVYILSGNWQRRFEAPD